MEFKLLLADIMNGWVEARTQPFKNHPTAKLIRNKFAEYIKSLIKDQYPKFEVKASAGSGNWADIAWLSILNPDITTSTQSGVYPVYLFRADGSGVYLSLGFGTTELKNKHGNTGAKDEASKLRDTIRKAHSKLSKWDPSIELHSRTDLGRSYEWATAGAKFYSFDGIPESAELIEDLFELLNIYDGVNLNSSVLQSRELFNMVSLPKSFLLLAGISGTGKTRFVREQAKVTGSLNDTYCLTPVRPDWHEPSDLLGYVSRLNNKESYVTTDVLKFIVRAWKHLFDSNLNFVTSNIEGRGASLVVRGDTKSIQTVKPYWLCLDEMNLAPVEQYFADYLSVLETREWRWDDDDFEYMTDPLLKASVIRDISTSSELRNSLDLSDSSYDVLWQHIEDYGIGLPLNLIVAGTVNMDETTHGFSRKVIDRALSFDFGEFFPNDLEDFFEAKNEAKIFGFPTHSQANKDMFASVAADPDVTKTRGFFEAINEVLKGTPFELAFRAYNELCLSVCSFSPKDDAELQAVFDDFLMCKVLPRIEGDEDKLQGPAKIEGQNILEQLSLVLAKELNDIWDSERVDLMRKRVGSEEPIQIACRSRNKLERMNKLLNNGFTSFWP